MVSMRRRPGQEGWTLVELTVVISLIVVLSTLALVGYRNAITRSREAVLMEDLFRMREAIDQYYADKEAYPDSLETLVTEGYIRSVPVDPFTNSADTWQPVLAELDAADPFVQGIFDVKTTYEGDVNEWDVVLRMVATSGTSDRGRAYGETDPMESVMLLDVAVPENALTVAVPAFFPASRRTETRPSWVRASWGSSVPRVVENVTRVPFWAAVPLGSVTTAVMVASPSSGRTDWLATTVIVESVGANSGRLSQAEKEIRARRASSGRHG